MSAASPLRLLIGPVIALCAVTGAFAAGPTDRDPDVAAATLFGTSLSRTLSEMQQAGVKLNPERFRALLLKVLNGEDLGMTYDEADSYLRSIMSPAAPPAIPPMDEEKENAWVRRQLSRPRTEELPGGVVLQRLVEGSGDCPGPESRLMVMYTARLSSGTEFDKTDEPFLMPVNHVVPGLSAALQKMHMGGTYRVFIPPAQGYGSEPVMDIIPGNSALDFTISLEEWNTK